MVANNIREKYCLSDVEMSYEKTNPDVVAAYNQSDMVVVPIENKYG